MKPMNELRLQQENAEHAGTGGCSAENRGLGFAPAFLDFATMTIHPSRFSDGRPAPFHLIHGLPAKPTLIAGFERNGFFYTRAAAARAVAEWRVGGHGA
jgi:hypothetical protein